MKNGNIEDLYNEVARRFIAQGLAEEVKPKTAAQIDAAPSKLLALETAMLEPKQETAIVKFVRTARSRIGV